VKKKNGSFFFNKLSQPNVAAESKDRAGAGSTMTHRKGNQRRNDRGEMATNCPATRQTQRDTAKRRGGGKRGGRIRKSGILPGQGGGSQLKFLNPAKGVGEKKVSRKPPTRKGWGKHENCKNPGPISHYGGPKARQQERTKNGREPAESAPKVCSPKCTARWGTAEGMVRNKDHVDKGNRRPHLSAVHRPVVERGEHKKRNKPRWGWKASHLRVPNNQEGEV